MNKTPGERETASETLHSRVCLTRLDILMNFSCSIAQLLGGMSIADSPRLPGRPAGPGQEATAAL